MTYASEVVPWVPYQARQVGSMGKLVEAFNGSARGADDSLPMGFSQPDRASVKFARIVTY